MTKKASKDTGVARQSYASVPIILNNTNGPRVIPYGGVSSEDGTGVIDLERMRFVAGLNMPADPEAFAQVSVLPSYKRWVAEGILEELEAVSDVPTVGKADEVVIEASASRKSMEWWLSQEVRPSVRKKLEAKISEMTRQRVSKDD